MAENSENKIMPEFQGILRNELLHHSDSTYVREKLSDLVSANNQAIKESLCYSTHAISTLRDISRLHGLPNSFQKILLDLLELELPQTLSFSREKFQLTLLLILKYSVNHNQTFISVEQLANLLLKLFPIDQLCQNEDHFKKESITQLMLAITTILDRDKTKSNEIELCKLEKYLPFISGSFKTEVWRSLEKVSPGLNREQTSFRKKAVSNLKSGEEIIRSIQEKKRISASAYVVKSQERVAVTTESCTSEKTQMTKISLSEALNAGKTNTVEANRTQETVPENPQKESTSVNVPTWSHLLEWLFPSLRLVSNINTLLSKAKNKSVICGSDILLLIRDWRRDRSVVGGFYGIVCLDNNIAGMIDLISAYQGLETNVIVLLLDFFLSKDLNESYSLATLSILQTTERHCIQIGSVPIDIEKQLNNFWTNTPRCNSDMKKKILEILSVVSEESKVSSYIKKSIENLYNEVSCEAELIYLQQQVINKPWMFEKSKDIVPGLINVAQNLNSWAVHGDPSAVEIYTEKNGVIEKIKGENLSILLSNALQILDYFLQIDSSPELKPKEIESLINLANSNEYIKTDVIHCIIRSLEKGLKVPCKSTVEVYLKQLNETLKFLLEYVTSPKAQDRLQIFILIILCKIWQVPEFKETIEVAPFYFHFFRKWIIRNDVFFLVSANVKLEEELDIDFFVKPASEEYELVSTYAAKILLMSLANLKFPFIDELILNEISQVLVNRPSKMTKILLAEALFLVAKLEKAFFSNDSFDNLQIECFSKINDVRVYTAAAYCTALSNPRISSLNLDQVNFLVSLYSFKEVSLGEVNLSEWINPNILKAFERACKEKLKLSEDVFRLLACVLDTTDKEDSVATILKIVSSFCKKNANELPSRMVKKIENIFLESNEFKNICLEIFERCMQTGTKVTEPVIEEIASSIFLEPKNEDLNKLIQFARMLFSANENQELSDFAYDTLQMELIGLRLHPDCKPYLSDFGFNNNGDTKKIFQLLSKFILKGNRVSPLNLQVFQHLLKSWKGGNERITLIENLTCVLDNGQILPNKIVESVLVEEGDFTIQVKFAEAVVKIGQQLPESFLQTTCSNLDGKNKEQFLKLIRKMIKHNHALPQEILNNYLAYLSKLAFSNPEGLHPDLQSVIYLLENKAVEDVSNFKSIKDIFLKSAQSQGAISTSAKKVLRLLPENCFSKIEIVQLDLAQISTEGAVQITKSSYNEDTLSNQLLLYIERVLKSGSECQAKWTDRRRDELEQELAANKDFVEKTGRLLLPNKIILTEFEAKIIESLFFTIANSKKDKVKESSKKVVEQLIIERNFTPNETFLTILDAAEEKDKKWLEGLMNQEENPLEEWKHAKTNEEKKAALVKMLKDPKWCTKQQIETLQAAISTSDQDGNGLSSVGNVLASSICTLNSLSIMAPFSPTVLAVIEKEILNGTGTISVEILKAYGIIQARSENSMECLNVLVGYFESNKLYLTPLEIILIFKIFKKAAVELQNIPRGLLDLTVNLVADENPLITAKCIEILLILRKTNQWKQEVSCCWSDIIKNIEALSCEVNQAKQDQKESGMSENDDEESDEVEILSTQQQENLLHALYSVEICEIGVLRNTDKIQWAHDLLLFDTIMVLAPNIINEQIELFPIASELCSLVSPGERLEILESIKDYHKQYPFTFTSFQLLIFINSHLRPVKNTEIFQGIMENCGDAEWLKSIALKEICKTLCEKNSDLNALLGTRILEENCAKVPLNILELVIQKLKKGFSRHEFQAFLDFLSNSSSKFHMISRHLKKIEGVQPLEDLQTALQVLVLVSFLPKSELPLRLKQEIQELLSRNYEFSLLQTLISITTKAINENIIKPGGRGLEILENILYQMKAYSVSPEFFSEIFKVLEQSAISNWVEITNDFVMGDLYEGCDGVKSVESIAKDFTDTYPSQKENLKDFSQMVKHIRDGNFPSELSGVNNVSSSTISSWSSSDILSWAQALKQRLHNGQEHNLRESLAVISRACILHKEYRLTPIQILSIQTAVGSSKNKGKLLQVATGSGKSTIIAAIAVLKTLQGLSVDIYTSSPVLAERDAKDWAIFYKTFGLECDHNGERSKYIKGEKFCYKRTTSDDWKIVYGDTSQFQFDVLRDEYSGLGTRAGRDYSESFAIVDEVDSMLVDENSKLARLSSPIPGMDCLHSFYHLIWQRLFVIQQRLCKVQDKTYYLEGERSRDENGNLLYSYLNAEGTKKTIDSIAEFIHRNKDNDDELEKANICAIADIDNFVSDHLTKYTKALLGEEEFKEAGELIQKFPLPKSLLKFAKSQVNNWVDSALTAVAFRENVQYVVDENQIKPVDFQTSGIIQNSTNWSNGLHQFLQIKHNLRISTETVTTNFLSNMAMFKNYDRRLVGLTGTLGSSGGQQFLEEVYNVETVIIPELHYPLFRKMPNKILESKEEWISTVVHSALHESAKKRAVLVICQTIEQAESFAEEVEMKGNRPVKLYTRNNQNQEKHVRQVNPGDIIVGTSIVGRGNDIKTKHVEKYGGLHVILTFLADSLRVEQQVFGRTARQGNKGTGQLIIFSSEGPTLENGRNKREEDHLKNFKQNQLIAMQTKDELFKKFCKEYSSMQTRADPLTVVEETILQSVEQEWATFLKMIEDGKISAEKAASEYEEFISKIKDDFKNGNSIQRTESCFYWIQLGNFYFKANKNDQAKEAYNKAILIDSDFCAGAHAGNGFCYLRTRIPKDTYKTEAISHFDKALKISSVELGLYMNAKMFAQLRGADLDSELCQQLIEKMNLIGDFSNNVQSNRATIIRSLRRVYATKILKENLKVTTQVDDFNPEVKKEKFEGQSQFRLEFHNLTYYRDNGLECQAIHTIEKCETFCKKFTIQVENQNMQTLMEMKEKVKMDLQLNKIHSWTGAQTLVEKFIPENVTVMFSGKNYQALEDTVKLSISEFVSISYEVDKVHFRKTITQDFDIKKEIPKDACILVELDFKKFTDKETFEKLQSISEISIVLKNISVRAADLNSEIICNIFEENVTIYHDLDAHVAKTLINNLRNKNVQFTLGMENLSHENANNCILNADRKQNTIKENKLKELCDQYSSHFIPLETLQEMMQRGILLMPQFGEDGFIPWKSILSVAMIASAQVVAGGVLVCTAYGATVGLGLISEGMSDYMTCYRAYSSREFDWKSYAIQKAISMSISAASMGLGELANAAKGVSQIGNAAASQGLKEAGKKVARGVAQRTLNETIKASSKNLQSLVLKQIAVEGAETLGRTVMNSAINSLSEFSLEKNKHHIIAKVEEEINTGFRKSECTAAFAAFTAMDSIRGVKMLDMKIISLMNEVTHPQSRDCNKAWDQVGYPLLEGILSNPRLVGTTASLTFRLWGMIHGSIEIQTVVFKVTKYITEKLQNEVSTFTLKSIIQERLGLDSERAELIVNLMQFEESGGAFKVEKFPTKEELDELKIEGVDLSKLRELFQILNEKESKFCFESDQMSKLIKTVVDHLATHIIQVINRQLISPVATFAVGTLVKKMSKWMQNKYLVNLAEMSEDQLSGSNVGITIEDQIHGNAKDYTGADKLRESFFNTTTITGEQIENTTLPEKLSTESKQAISEMLNPKIPANAMTLILLAKIHGVEIKIVEGGKNYVPTEDDKESGRNIIIYEGPEAGEQMGHYMLLDKDTGETLNFSQDGEANNCGFNVISHITGESPMNLRCQAARFVACNQEKYAEISKPVNWIKEKYPQDAIKLLLFGGKGNKNITSAKNIRKQEKADKKNEKVSKEEEEKKLLINGKVSSVRDEVIKEGTVERIPEIGNEKGKFKDLHRVKTKEIIHNEYYKYGKECEQDIQDEFYRLMDIMEEKGFTCTKSAKNKLVTTRLRLDCQGSYTVEKNGKTTTYVNCQVQFNGPRCKKKRSKNESTTLAELHPPQELFTYYEKNPERLMKFLRNEFELAFESGCRHLIGFPL